MSGVHGALRGDPRRGEGGAGALAAHAPDPRREVGEVAGPALQCAPPQSWGPVTVLVFSFFWGGERLPKERAQFPLDFRLVSI